MSGPTGSPWRRHGSPPRLASSAVAHICHMWVRHIHFTVVVSYIMKLFLRSLLVQPMPGVEDFR